MVAQQPLCPMFSKEECLQDIPTYITYIPMTVAAFDTDDEKQPPCLSSSLTAEADLTTPTPTFLLKWNDFYKECVSSTSYIPTSNLNASKIPTTATTSVVDNNDAQPLIYYLLSIYKDAYPFHNQVFLVSDKSFAQLIKEQMLGAVQTKTASSPYDQTKCKYSNKQ